MLGITMVASLVYLTFLDALRVAEDVVWSALFAANLRFLDQNVDYYAHSCGRRWCWWRCWPAG